jgi:prolipoprotein diacylglyceryltransferase
VAGTWGILTVIGVAVALVIQLLVIPAVHAHLHRVLTVSLPAVAGGIVGAKAWFIVQHRRDGRREGWCIQGLIAGVTAVAATLLAVTGTNAGVFLDVTAPGLMFGMAVGRIGCLFAGCCVGRPTTSPGGYGPPTATWGSGACPPSCSNQASPPPWAPRPWSPRLTSALDGAVFSWPRWAPTPCSANCCFACEPSDAVRSSAA